MASERAKLQLENDAAKVAGLDPSTPLTIGRAPGNRLCLADATGVSEHHAVVRFSGSHGWVVCDWQSSDGTYLEGRRIQRCRPLADGDRIQLGQRGPVLRFTLQASPPQTAPPPTAAPTTANRAGPDRPTIDFDGNALALSSIQTARVTSTPRHPHIFSWWLLLCLGGLLLLPFPLLFWLLQIGALAGWILLGSRKEHTLRVVLQDGHALSHRFANRSTALSHCNGIRRAIGQSPQTSAAP
jgi:hypothetical protein